MLEARKVTKRFGSVAALDSLDLRIAAGEVVCLLGANGAGKTTAVNLFLGFAAPDEGEILVAGRPLKDDIAAARMLMAYIPDQVSLFPLLSGAENLAYFARLARRTLDREEIVTLLGDAGLATDAIVKPVAGYSKGMRQKVGIAIALAKRARALILDEPLSGLDPLAANDFGTRLRALRDDGIAVLMVTHDIFRAREVADRIGIMKSGRLVDMITGQNLSADALDRLYVQHMHG